MRLLKFAIPLLAAISSSAAYGDELPIGFAAPLTGPMALLGEQMRQGAEAAATAFERPAISLEVADSACTATSGAETARRFVAANAGVVAGFLCTEAVEAALPILKNAGIPVVISSVRTDSLTDNRHKTGWPIFRLAPRADGEAAAVASILTKLWADKLFAIIDDGTIYGRDLAEGFRLAAEQAGLKPVYVDNYRPQLDNQIGLVGRLKKSGATHVFVGGDREDVAIIERDAQKLGLGLTVAGGEALRAVAGDVPLAPGTLMIGLPEWADVADPAVVAALRSREIEPEGQVLPAYAAVQIAISAAIRAKETGTPVIGVLTTQKFDTAIGAISFDEKGDRSQSPWRLFSYDGQQFQEAK